MNITPFLFIGTLLLQAILFFLVRLLPIWKVRHQGCDAYYFLLSAEVFRAHRKLPVKLPPYYLADIEEQWYPPAFTVFLGLLPDRIVKHYYWLINPILDFMNLVVMDVFISIISGSTEAVLLANIIYIFMPVFVSEYSNLTSRSLANIVFSCFLIFLYYAFKNPVWYVVVALSWCTILFTHKLTAQGGLFLVILVAIVYATPIPLVVTLGIIPFLLLFTGGYYLKILKGHWDIVSFWHRNLPLLGAHQIYESPIYGIAKDKTSSKGLLKRTGALFLYNPFIYFVLVVFAYSPELVQMDAAVYYLFVCITAITAWAFLTTFIPYLNSLGEGYKYIKYTALPSAVFISLIFDNLDTFSITLLVISSIVTIMGLVLSIYLVLTRSKGIIDEDLRKMLDYLKSKKEFDMLGCINLDMADAIVYFARKKVLWGTHHYNFNEKMVEFFPVFRAPIDVLTQKYGLKYWCINASYVNPEDIFSPSSKKLIKSFGQYQLYEA